MWWIKIQFSAYSTLVGTPVIKSYSFNCCGEGGGGETTANLGISSQAFCFPLTSYGAHPEITATRACSAV